MNVDRKITSTIKFIDNQPDAVTQAEQYFHLFMGEEFKPIEGHITKLENIMIKIFDLKKKSPEQIEFKYMRQNKNVLFKIADLLTQMPDSERKQDLLFKIIDKFCEIDLVDDSITLLEQFSSGSLKKEKSIVKLIGKYCDLGKVNVAESLLAQLERKSESKGIALCLVICKYVENTDVNSLNRVKSLIAKIPSKFFRYKQDKKLNNFLFKVIDGYCENCEIGSVSNGIDLLLEIGSDFEAEEYKISKIIVKLLIKYSKKETREKFDLLFSRAINFNRDLGRDLIWAIEKFVENDLTFDEAVDLMTLIPPEVYEHQDMAYNILIKKCCKNDLLEKAGTLCSMISSESVYKDLSLCLLIKKYFEKKLFEKAGTLIPQVTYFRNFNNEEKDFLARIQAVPQVDAVEQTETNASAGLKGRNLVHQPLFVHVLNIIFYPFK